MEGPLVLQNQVSERQAQMDFVVPYIGWKSAGGRWGGG